MEAVNPAARRGSVSSSSGAGSNAWALAIFALLVAGAPLLFGAVDRISQIALAGIFALGICFAPPAARSLSRWGNGVVIALLGVLVFKEFAPHEWFGSAQWRTELVEDFALVFPWTHHPEPARALDALLAGALGLLWFLWVRHLAAQQVNRVVLAWILFGAVALVATVAFATRGIDSRAIYGLRYTTGWSGFGPFPNRNHTGSLLAMGAVLGCGCIAWAGARRKWPGLILGIPLVGFLFIALLASESRGALVAFVAGLGCFLGLALLKTHSRKALGLVLAAALVLGAAGLAFGAKVFARFGSAEAGDVSNLTRVRVWRDTFEMCKDAPLFGHGLNSFTQLFPLYQKLELENTMVAHPESSWLQWLTEVGAVPVLLAAVALAIFAVAQLRQAFARKHSFFIRVASFAAVATLLCHAVFDVPAHRWGTMIFALAALAIACPRQTPERSLHASKKTALIPLGIAIFWSWPFLFDAPAWSPLALNRLLARDATTDFLPLEELERASTYFPLEPKLHQSIGTREVHRYGRTKPAPWQRRFALATRLVPASWRWPVAQARTVQQIAPGLALGYWQQALERGGIHREDVLRMAVEESGGSPLAEIAWARYVEANPQLLLTYARLVPEAQGRHFYGLWWKERALTDALRKEEIEAFYDLVGRWGTRAQFDQWMTARAEWQTRDGRRWATILHGRGDDKRAWELLASTAPDPPFPAPVPMLTREQLEAKWRLGRQNFFNAQQLALARFSAGETLQSHEIILQCAAYQGAPPWFVQKAAHIYAQYGQHRQAVEKLLEAPAAK